MKKYTFDRNSWQDIAAERRKQIMAGHGPAHDDLHKDSELLMAAVAYMAVPGDPFWPWDDDGFNPSNDPIDNLVVAGALISAEIDRLKRLRMAGQPVLSGFVVVATDPEEIVLTLEGARAIRDELAKEMSGGT